MSMQDERLGETDWKKYCRRDIIVRMNGAGGARAPTKKKGLERSFEMQLVAQDWLPSQYCWHVSFLSDADAVHM